MVSDDSAAFTVLDDHRKLTMIVADRAFPLLLETYLYALYTVLAVYFVYRRWLDRETTSLPVFMLLVTLAMFILFTAYWALDVYLLWIEVYRYLPQQRSAGSHLEAMFLDGLWIPWSTAFYVQTAFRFAMLVLGDIVLLWRAYVVWGRPRWLLILSTCIAIVEGCACILVLLVLFTQSLPQSSRGFGYSLFAKSYDTSLIISNVITAYAQLFATLLIVYKAWIHWREVREFSNGKQIRHSLAMLAVVIESGVLYFVLLLWYGLISYLGSPDSLVCASVCYYMTPLIAMYPTLVVILVATRRSVLERSIMSGNPLSGLRFATNPGSVRGDHDSTSSRCPTCHRIELETAVIGSCTMAAGGSSERDTVAVYDQDENEKYDRAILMSLAPAGPQLSRTKSSGG